MACERSRSTDVLAAALLLLASSARAQAPPETLPAPEPPVSPPLPAATAIQAAELAAPPPSAIMPENAPAWADPAVGRMPFRTDLREFGYPSQSVRGQPTDLGYFESEFSLAFPIW